MILIHLKRSVAIALLLLPLSQLLASPSNKAEHFFAVPAFSSPQISPDGDFLSYLAPASDDGKRALYTLELDTGISYGFKGEKDQEISSYHWMNDEWLVFNVTIHSNRALGVYAVKRDDAKSLATCELLTGSRILRSRLPDPNQFWVHQIDSNAFKDSQLVKYDILLISTRKGEMLTTFASNGRAVERFVDPEGGFVERWILNPKGDPAIARSQRDENDHYYRIFPDSKWEQLTIDPEEWTLHKYANSNEVFATGYNQSDTQGLYLFDLNDQTFSGPILQNEKYDLDDLSIVSHPKTSELLGMIFEGQTIENHWKNPNLKAIQTLIDSQFPNRRNIIQSFSDDLNRIVFSSTANNIPPSYYLFDVKQSKIKMLRSAYPDIQASELSPVFRFEFTSTDQLKLEALFSRPTKPINPNKKPPLLLLIHGGPWARDLWTYNPEVQFLTSLGYAVLQVNYRGSTGFGSKVSSENAFEFEAMMSDINKAADLVVKQGFVDPDRIGIMGASFGGYASLFLAAKRNDFYKCAVATAGVYEVVQQIESLRSKSKHGHKAALGAYHYWKSHVGDPKLDEAYLKSISPLYFADQIKCPVFIAHGKNDNVVSVQQSRKMLKQLKKSKIELETYFKYGEGHGFRDQQNRIEYYQKVEAFLAKYL